jgi:hypothetical protein
VARKVPGAQVCVQPVVRVDGLAGQSQIHPRRHEKEACGQFFCPIPQRDRHVEREPAAGRVSGHDRRTLPRDRPIGGEHVFEGRRMRVLGRAPILRQEHAGPVRLGEMSDETGIHTGRVERVRAAVRPDDPRGLVGALGHDEPRARVGADPADLDAARRSSNDRQRLHDRAARPRVHPERPRQDVPVKTPENAARQLHEGDCEGRSSRVGSDPSVGSDPRSA